MPPVPTCLKFSISGTVKRKVQLMQRTFSWAGMYATAIDTARVCTTCQYHSHKAPAAPIQGHTEASRPSEKITLDIIHLPEQEGPVSRKKPATNSRHIHFMVPQADPVRVRAGLGVLA